MVVEVDNHKVLESEVVLLETRMVQLMLGKEMKVVQFDEVWKMNLGFVESHLGLQQILVVVDIVDSLVFHQEELEMRLAEILVD